MFKAKRKVQTLLLTFLLLIVSAFGFLTEAKTADAVGTDFYGNYISLSLQGKENGEWIINVQNPQSYPVRIFYNRRMCYGNDAAAWNGDLHDVVKMNADLDPQAIVTVNVTPNGFAGYIAFSFIDPIDGKRYITYAHNLDKNTKTMTILNAVKD